MNVLVTGGAGFIGSHLTKALLMRSYSVRVLDALVEQVHGSQSLDHAGIPQDVEFIQGDVRDPIVWDAALADIDVVYHLAAEVGVGQSMYDIVRYMSVNTMGTCNLLQLLANGRHKAQKIVVASSMSIYGEGAYTCSACGIVAPHMRAKPQLQDHEWEILCPNCGSILQPLPTTEEKPLHPASVYAISKRDQEELCLSLGRAYGIPTVALRFFNTYGSGQALSNPYTGVAAIFASRLLNGSAPLIFEDGLQARDFVHVSDVVAGLLLAMDRSEANFQAFNIGSGSAITVKEVAVALSTALGADIPPRITNQYREGDIRHCFADITKAQKLLGYAPRITFYDGIHELVAWVKLQTAVDRVETAKIELDLRGLTT